jgi:hypothetical protein
MLVHKISEITRVILEVTLGGFTRELLCRLATIDASSCVGSEHNRFTSSIQLDFGNVPGGNLGVSEHDHPCRYSVICKLSLECAVP